MNRIYYVELKLDDQVKRPARLIRASNRAQAERHVIKGCLATRVATQDDVLALAATGVETAGEDASE